jgi:hypothetical protein
MIRREWLLKYMTLETSKVEIRYFTVQGHCLFAVLGMRNHKVPGPVVFIQKYSRFRCSPWRRMQMLGVHYYYPAAG